MQTLRTLELYCGCGGLSFADRHTEDVVIETRWAVDCERSMIETFKANYPYAHVSLIALPGTSLRQMPEESAQPASYRGLVVPSMFLTRY